MAAFSLSSNQLALLYCIAADSSCMYHWPGGNTLQEFELLGDCILAIKRIEDTITILRITSGYMSYVGCCSESGCFSVHS